MLSREEAIAKFIIFALTRPGTDLLQSIQALPIGAIYLGFLKPTNIELGDNRIVFVVDLMVAN